jgi:endonuclease YncB( thermonuclease family)
MVLTVLKKNQDYGRKAKQFTSDMVFGKQVKIDSYGQDQYGRAICLVYLGSNNQCLYEELINSGYAEVYREYCKDGLNRK